MTDWIRSKFQRAGGKTPEANPTQYVGGKKQFVLCPPNPFWMESEEVTIAELLRAKGYRTAYIGKWHLGDEAWFPEHQGFEVNFGGCDYGQPPSYFDPFNQPKGRHASLREGIFQLPAKNPGEYLTDREVDEACGLIRKWKAEPFFIQLSHYAVHTPLQAHNADVSKYLRDGVTKKQAVYAAMVESVDRAVGKVRRTLEATGLDKNTVIWFTSDNGGLDNGQGEPTENLPLREGKGYPYEGGIRIPTIVQWKNQIPPSIVSDTPTCSIDILPTIAEWCELPADKDRVIDGVSFGSHMTSGGKESISARPLLWHFPHYRGKIMPYSILRDGNWKLLHYYAGKNGKGESSELYDLANDPGEQNDLAANELDRVKKLKTTLMQQLEAMGARIPRPNPEYQP